MVYVNPIGPLLEGSLKKSPPKSTIPNLPRPEIKDFQKPPLREVVHLGGTMEVFPPFFLGGFPIRIFFGKKKTPKLIFKMMENFNPC